MTAVTAKSKDISPGGHAITVTQGMRGWFAVEIWKNNEEPELGTFWEPWQSCDLSFKTEEEARVWAIQLAENEGLPYLVEGTRE